MKHAKELVILIFTLLRMTTDLIFGFGHRKQWITTDLRRVGDIECDSRIIKFQIVPHHTLVSPGAGVSQCAIICHLSLALIPAGQNFEGVKCHSGYTCLTAKSWFRWVNAKMSIKLRFTANNPDNYQCSSTPSMTVPSVASASGARWAVEQGTSALFVAAE